MVDQSRLRAVFNEALERSGAERAAYLDGACLGEPELRAEVEALLAGAEESDSFLSTPTQEEPVGPTLETPRPESAVDDMPTMDVDSVESLREEAGSRIGPYKLLQAIGEGGFGTVFMAEQEEPVRRRVALKVIKLGMDTRQVVARFEQERQALAIMDHPHIAKVFDAGATESGRPYFVMELCTGEPITSYCDRNGLSVRERLELFAQVCAAVQHAHQKGLIHRDIKPSNVLVATQDGKPHAKVIDFGIAKATTARLTEKTFFTEHRQLIGTPEYMSPEQAEGSLDIDTRTDVYALGVLLYELLAGATPFDSRSLRSAAFAEIQRIIREVDPPTPSTRLSQGRETIAGVAASRRSDPKKLSSLVRGELDWIVMKALEKDRQRRYDTATGLGLDIQRYLSGEAVVAAPASRVYRVRKFVRRNRGGVSAGAAVAAALLIGVVAFAWQADVARAQRDLAVAAREAEAAQRREAAAQRDRATEAEEQASRRADQLSQVAEFQANMLGSIDATEAGAALMGDLRLKFIGALERGGVDESERAVRSAALRAELEEINATDTAVDMIDRTFLKPAIAEVNDRFADQPVVDASLRHTLGEVYLQLGRYEDAKPLMERSLETRRRELGDEHDLTLVSMNNLALLRVYMGDLEQAEALYREALEVRRRTLGVEDERTLTLMTNLGNLLRSQGRSAEAEPLLVATVEGRRNLLGDEHRNTLIAINSLGYLRIEQGRYEEAEPYWREAYETGTRVFGAEDPDVAIWTNNMGGLAQVLGKYGESEGYYREAYEASRRSQGEEHPKTLFALENLAGALERQGRYAEAEQVYRQALAGYRNSLGEDHSEVAGCMSGLATVLRRQSKLEEAEMFSRQSLERRRRTLGDSHPETFNGMTALAGVLSDREKVDEAEALYREAMERSASMWGADHPERLTILNNLGGMLVTHGRFEEAEPLLIEAVAARRRVSGTDHSETAIALYNLARFYTKQERFEESEPHMRESAEILHRTLGDDHPHTLLATESIAQILEKMDLLDEAAAIFFDVLSARESRFGIGVLRTAVTQRRLGCVLRKLTRFEEAEQALLEAERVTSAQESPTASEQQACYEELAALYEAWHAADPTGGYDVKAAEWEARLTALDVESAAG